METKIEMDTYKTVTKAIAHSDNIDDMSHHLAQLLVAALGIKGCALFILNPDTQDLEVLASIGLSTKYLTKGPLNAPKSIKETFQGVPVIIPDIGKDDTLQYPEAAKEEGIAAIVSIPIEFLGEVIGVLRLYHNKIWHVPQQDLESLHLLADHIGLAMTYTRLLNAVKSISDVIENVLPKNMSSNLW